MIIIDWYTCKNILIICLIVKSQGRVSIQNGIVYHYHCIVEELVAVGPLFKELVQPTILTQSDCI